MTQEIERKFLVRDGRWRGLATSSRQLRQGYIANTARSSVRVRAAEGQAWLSVKSMTPGRVRDEFEYEIPIADAQRLLADHADGPLIEKTRFEVPIGGHRFEVDEFSGANRGLVIAEIELVDPDEVFPRPDWLGTEVTDDSRYANFRLASEPFGSWPPILRERVLAGGAAP